MAIVIIIAAVSSWCFWSKKKLPKKPVEKPREMEVWQVGTSEPRNEPENYYATIRPKATGASNKSKAPEDSDYVYENEIYTTMPAASASNTERDYEGTYIYAN